MDHYYCTDAPDSVVEGPVSQAKLRTLRASGQIADETRVTKAGSENWRTYKDEFPAPEAASGYDDFFAQDVPPPTQVAPPPPWVPTLAPPPEPPRQLTNKEKRGCGLGCFGIFVVFLILSKCANREPGVSQEPPVSPTPAMSWTFSDELSPAQRAGAVLSHAQIPEKSVEVIRQGSSILTTDQHDATLDENLRYARADGDTERVANLQKKIFFEKDTAFRNVIQAQADNGDMYAAYYLALYCYPWRNDFGNAADCFQYAKQAETDLTRHGQTALVGAMALILGDLYLGSAETPIPTPAQDTAEAVRYYELALQDGMAPAIFRLLPIYATGGAELRASSKGSMNAYPARSNRGGTPNFERACVLARLLVLTTGDAAGARYGKQVLDFVTPKLSASARANAGKEASRLFAEYRQQYPDAYPITTPVPAPVRPSSGQPMTRQQWKEKVSRSFAWLPGSDLIVPSAQFQQVVGAPSRTQTIGGQAYWYYVCSDGVIQLSMDATGIQMGMVTAQVNDY